MREAYDGTESDWEKAPKSIRMVLALEKTQPKQEKWKKLHGSLDKFMRETLGYGIEIYDGIKVPPCPE